VPGSRRADAKHRVPRSTRYVANAQFPPQPTAQREWIDSIVEQAALRHEVDPNLVRAIIRVESNFNPHAVSRKGAIGLMQLMPYTARSLNVSNPFDPRQNVDAGVRHFKKLLDSYGGNLELSLAAYNAGSSAVQRSRGVPRYAETQNYVKKITELYGSNTAKLFSSKPPIVFKRDAEGHLSASDID
jgi:soluble lytic murein transglycosylase-like protein